MFLLRQGFLVKLLFLLSVSKQNPARGAGKAAPPQTGPRHGDLLVF